MDAVCAEADLVIHMAGSRTVARCMLSGVPQLPIATGMEQLFAAKAAQGLGTAFLLDASSAGFEVILRQALIRARQGRRPYEGVRSELRDGSFMTRELPLLFQTVSLPSLVSLSSAGGCRPSRVDATGPLASAPTPAMGGKGHWMWMPDS
jgi:hypothetical protein